MLVEQERVMQLLGGHSILKIAKMLAVIAG